MSNDLSHGCLCEEPPCPTVTLLCDSISASKSKCGLTNSNLPNRYFSTLDLSCEITDDNIVQTDPCTAPFSGSDVRESYFTTTTTTPAHGEVDLSTCAQTNTNGSADTNDHITHCDGSVTDIPSTIVLTLSSTCGVGGTITVSVSGDTVTYHSEGHTSGTAGGIPFSRDVIRDRIQSYGGEYLTADLITNTEDALPSYDSDFDDSCSAVRALSATESSYTISRFKYKFRVTCPVTCQLKILWNETFKPTLAAAVTYCGSSYAIGATDPNPTHWTKTAKTYTFSFSGNPCGPTNPGGAPSNPTGTTSQYDSAVQSEVTEPASNGTISITDIRWSILNGSNDTDTYNPTPSSIEGVDQFAGGTTSYLCNSRTAAQPNCIPAA